MLRLADVVHSFGEDEVLTDLSMEVAPSEVLAVIGPSGVGKTTLLRMLSLSLEPDQGTVRFDGQDVWNLENTDRLAMRRRIGMVFQEASLFDTTVARNVEYGLRIRRSWSERLESELRSILRSNGTADDVSEALDIVGLTDKMDQPSNSLSGGEAQRVSFARAVAYNPDILLLDEPTSDLDPRNTDLIEEAIREARTKDIGIVVATHDMHQAERVADRVAVLLGGSITEIGPTEKIFDEPSDDRTRKFISGELVY